MVNGSCPAPDDCTAIVWEVQTGRCIKRWQFEQKVISVSWNPNTELPVVAIATGHSAILANPMAWTSSIEPFRAATSVEEDQPVRWTLPTPAQKEDGLLCILEHQTDLKQVIWHRKGDYFATIAPKSNDVVLIHQLSRRQSQRPFQKSIGEVERVLFHPQKPQLVVASRQAIRVYDLAEQRKVATLKPTVQWLSSIDIHPQGEHMLVGAYDRKACWFETELSSKPCRVFRHYNRAVRQVAFHRKNPLFATCGDDGNVLVFHCRIFDDWATDTLLVPVKILRGHRVVSGNRRDGLCLSSESSVAVYFRRRWFRPIVHQLELQRDHVWMVAHGASIAGHSHSLAKRNESCIPTYPSRKVIKSLRHIYIQHLLMADKQLCFELLSIYTYLLRRAHATLFFGAKSIMSTRVWAASISCTC